MYLYIDYFLHWVSFIQVFYLLLHWIIVLLHFFWWYFMYVCLFKSLFHLHYCFFRNTWFSRNTKVSWSACFVVLSRSVCRCSEHLLQTFAFWFQCRMFQKIFLRNSNFTFQLFYIQFKLEVFFLHRTTLASVPFISVSPAFRTCKSSFREIFSIILSRFTSSLSDWMMLLLGLCRVHFPECHPF